MSGKRSLFEIHLAVLLFGLAGLFGKWLALSPVIIVLGRVFFASVSLILIFLFTKQNLRIYPRKNYFLLFFLGLILSLHWVSFFKAIQVSTVAVGLLSYSIFPIFLKSLNNLKAFKIHLIIVSSSRSFESHEDNKSNRWRYRNGCRGDDSNRRNYYKRFKLDTRLRLC